VILEWDPRKALANLAKHGVDFHEAGTVLDDPLATTFPDPEHSIEEPRFTTIGASLSGRILSDSPHGSWQGDPSNQREAGNLARAQVL